MDLSAEALIRIFVILLYVSVGPIAYRWLIPRLSSTGKRLATVMLAAQLLVILPSIFTQPSSSFEAWLWHLDREWNIPATLASMQLALVAFVALVSAWLFRARPAWHRLYFVGIGLAFFLLAYDEYAVVHEFIYNWRIYYIALGAAVVVATLAVAARSPKPTWISYAYLLIGLATSAAGGLLFESTCGNSLFEAIDRCSKHFWVEEPLEFLGIWLALIAMLIQFSDASPPPSLRVRRALLAFPVVWLLLLILSGAIHPVESYADGSASAAQVEYESGLQLHGYLMERGKQHIHLFLSPGQWDFHGQSLSEIGYSIHLVDQVSGDSIVSRDRVAHRRFFLLGPGYVPIYRQWVDLDHLTEAPANRAYWIVLTLWRNEGDEYVPQMIRYSDRQLLDDTQVILGELTLRAESSTPAPRDPLAVFNNGFTLDAVDMPERARAGESLTMAVAWRSDVNGSEDHAQFLHLGHEESGEWFVYDQQPLGERLPTRLWYEDLADHEAWQVPLPADLAPGRYDVFTGIYRARDRERVPASSADGNAFLDARVPLGNLVIE